MFVDHLFVLSFPFTSVSSNINMATRSVLIPTKVVIVRLVNLQRILKTAAAATADTTKNNYALIGRFPAGTSPFSYSFLAPLPNFDIPSFSSPETALSSLASL